MILTRLDGDPPASYAERMLSIWRADVSFDAIVHEDV